MQKRKTPNEAGQARLAKAVTKTHQVVQKVIDAISEAEASMRAARNSGTELTSDAITNCVYVPSATLPSVEVLGEPLLALAQVKGVARKRESGGKELLIAGIRPDVAYAYSLCQMVDKAVVEAWNEINETGNVSFLPPNARSAYRRTYQRNLCVSIREKVVQMNADRLMAMKAEDRKMLARKRELVAGVVQ